MRATTDVILLVKFGLGYYTHKTVAFEIYGGFGMGKGHGSDSASWFIQHDYHEMTARYHKIFLQPSIGLFSKRVEGALTFRVSAIAFDELDLWMDGEQEQISQHTRFFFEPALTLRVYPFDERFYFLGQVGSCRLINSELDDEQIDYDEMPYEPFHMSIGIGVKLKPKT